MRPFEGVFGSNSTLKILEYLLPRDDMEFNIQELADGAGVRWPTAQKVVKKLVERAIVKEVQKHGNAIYYELNIESPYIALLQDLNTLVIEDMLGDEALYQIRDYIEARKSAREKSKQEPYDPVAEDTSLVGPNLWMIKPQRTWLDERYSSEQLLIARAQTGRGFYDAPAA